MKKAYWVNLALLIMFAFSFAQQNLEKIKMELDFSIDRVGNAVITYKQSATAAQWKILNQTIGQNPSLLKRDLQHQLSAYELYDFSFKKDDMNRTFILTFKAKGVARYKGNGLWDIDVEKEFSPKKISEKDWYFTTISTEGNVVYEGHISVKLPEGVEKSEITVDEFGRRVLRYRLPPEKKFPIYLLAGGITAILGLSLIGASFVFKEKKQENEAT